MLHFILFYFFNFLLAKYQNIEYNAIKMSPEVKYGEEACSYINYL